MPFHGDRTPIGEMTLTQLRVSCGLMSAIGVIGLVAVIFSPGSLILRVFWSAVLVVFLTVMWATVVMELRRRSRLLSDRSDPKPE